MFKKKNAKKNRLHIFSPHPLFSISAVTHSYKAVCRHASSLSSFWRTFNYFHGRLRTTICLVDVFHFCRSCTSRSRQSELHDGRRELSALDGVTCRDSCRHFLLKFEDCPSRKKIFLGKFPTLTWQILLKRVFHCFVDSDRVLPCLLNLGGGGSVQGPFIGNK